MVHYLGFDMRGLADQLLQKLGGTREALKRKTELAGPTIKKLMEGGDVTHNVGYVVEPAEHLVPHEPDNFPARLMATCDWKRRPPGRPYGMVNCFGMPSHDPEVWKPDVARCVKLLNDLSPGKMLVLSV